jgi:hypothetical protein
MYYASSTIELPDLVHGIFHSISMEKNGNGMEWNGMEMEFSIMESITTYFESAERTYGMHMILGMVKNPRNVCILAV